MATASSCTMASICPSQQADDVDLEAVRDRAVSLSCHIGDTPSSCRTAQSYPEFDVFRGTRTSRAG